MSHLPPLRLVPDNDTGPELAERPARRKLRGTFVPRDWQMSLPFDDVQVGPTVVLIAMEAMTGSRLKDLLAARRPNCVVDLRELIRFDLPGTSRNDVFRRFATAGVHYAQDPLPWRELNAQDLTLRAGPISQVLMHEVAERDAKCIFVFVHRRGEVKHLAAHLSRIMAERIRGPWHLDEAD